MSAVLEITDFSQYYNSIPAVEHLNLTVHEGEIFGFIGHNGAGKSTTIKSIVGILPVKNGDIKIMGQSVRQDLKNCQQICAYIPDNPDLYGYMTGIEYINFISDVFHVSSEDRTERIKKYADLFEITPQLGILISSCSHGMKQKIALIAAFVHSPRLMVLDEPFVGLDPKAVSVLKDCMREFCQSGNAIFYSTHVLDVAERLCSHIGIIDHGRLVALGRTDDITAGDSLEQVFLAYLNGERAK